ncbi:uncharacterized protein LOC111265245 [Varroa jacobsoni]|uniref:uncharacterized protein LOC111265245 n=1 Tax=Varroa jacobsoni TaxID=62625 RepID=UPI000BF62B3C|nr:uncharacterized protein LOC111265245 [Varroa jacobsoni]
MLKFIVFLVLLIEVYKTKMTAVEARSNTLGVAGIPINLSSGDPRIIQSNDRHPQGTFRRQSSVTSMALFSSHPTDSSQLFVQMAPTVYSGNHVVPAHIVGAYEKELKPQVITLPPRSLDALGNIVADNVKDNISFERSLVMTPKLEATPQFEAQFHGVQELPRTIELNAPLDFSSQQLRKPDDYRGTAQVVDPEISEVHRKSAIQHAGEGDDGEVLEDHGPHGMPYRNLQDSKEQQDQQQYRKVDTYRTSRKVPKASAQNSNERDDQNLERHMVRDRYISEEDDYEDRLLQEKSDQRLYDKKHARVRTREKDGTKSERSSGLTFGTGQGLVNIQIGGRQNKNYRNLYFKNQRKPDEPMLTSSEDETDTETDETGDDPRHQSRRSLLRMPFKVLRGVTLGRGDDGTLAFNVNLG